MVGRSRYLWMSVEVRLDLPLERGSQIRGGSGHSRPKLSQIDMQTGHERVSRQLGCWTRHPSGRVLDSTSLQLLEDSDLQAPHLIPHTKAQRRTK